MADYRQIARHFPPVRDYLRNRSWVRRGEVVAYSPDQRGECFSTDALGFRHSVFRGRSLSLAVAGQPQRYGLVLGSSHVFGFGLPDNASTIASQLGEAVGFPVFNVCYPEADSRTLATTLLRILRSGQQAPELIVFFNGGDATRFAYTGKADALFGCPDFERPIEDRTEAEVDRDVPRLAYFSNFWVGEALRNARAAGSVFFVADDTTFFEKSRPDEIEAACQLGIAKGVSTRRFDIHRRCFWSYYNVRRKFIEDSGAAASLDRGFDDYLFIDEYHYRRETIALMAERLARSFEAVRRASPSS